MSNFEKYNYCFDLNNKDVMAEIDDVYKSLIKRRENRATFITTNGQLYQSLINETGKDDTFFPLPEK